MRAIVLVLLSMGIWMAAPIGGWLGKAYALVQDAPVKVLAVHSYRQDYPWTAAQNQGFKTALSQLQGVEWEIETEYLDTKRKVLSPEYAMKTVLFYREKYDGYEPDAIYVTDDNGLNFAVTYLSELFPGVPVIFSGVNDYSQLDRLDRNNVTGVFEKKAIQPNLQLLTQLIGDVRQIVVVGDGSPTYQAIKTELRKELVLNDKLTATFIEDDQLTSIFEKMARLPQQPVILTTLGAVRNEHNQVVPLRTTVSKLVGLQHQVIISMEDAYMFEGVLGGFLTSGLAQGQSAGELLVKYLSGQAIADLPPITESPNEYLFNDQVIEELELSLPSEIANQSRLINLRPNIFARYGNFAIAAIIVLSLALAVTLFVYLRTITLKNRQLTEQGFQLQLSEQSLQLESKLLAEVGRISQTGGWQIDLETNALSWSTETRRIHEVDDNFEPTVEKAIGFYAAESLERITEAVEKGIETGDPFDLELSIITAKKNLKYVRAMGEVVFKEGKATILLGVFQDITERKQAEEVISDAYEEVRRANQAKSEFLAAMSHEFRTPLNAIIGFSDILAREYMGPLGEPKYLEYAKDIFISGEHLLSLVNEVLDISAIEAGKREITKEPLSAREAIEECVSIIAKSAQEKDIRVNVIIEDGLPMFNADRVAIRQIILNLLANAIKFSVAGGVVEISAHADKASTVFTISDSGVGIADEKISELTRPFTRAERDPHKAVEGWGLGLAICKSLVDLHSGELVIESMLGAGTTVTIKLPMNVLRFAAR